MGSALELLTGILVLVNSAKNGDDLFLGRQGDGAGNGSAVALCGFDDFLAARVDELMILSLQANSDHFLVCHGCVSSLNHVLSCFCKPLGTVENRCTLSRAYHSAP